MITRRKVLLATGIGLLVASRLGQGQPGAAIRRVGWLSLGSKAAVADLDAAFRQGMRELGWQEGKNVEYRIAYADADASRLDDLAKELVRQKVDVILVGNGQSARAALRPRLGGLLRYYYRAA